MSGDTIVAVENLSHFETNPLYVISKLAVEKKVLYLMHLLIPIAFLPLRRWYLWLSLVPGGLLTLLVTRQGMSATVIENRGGELSQSGYGQQLFHNQYHFL